MDAIKKNLQLFKRNLPYDSAYIPLLLLVHKFIIYKIRVYTLKVQISPILKLE